LIVAVGGGWSGVGCCFGALAYFVVAVGGGACFGELVAGVESVGGASDLGRIVRGVVFVGSPACFREALVFVIGVFDGFFAG
jgi:hypothetical protein